MANLVDAIIGPYSQPQPAQHSFGHPIIINECTPWVQLSNKSTEFISVKKNKRFN